METPSKTRRGKRHSWMNSTAEAHVPAGMVDINNSTKYYSNYYTLKSQLCTLAQLLPISLKPPLINKTQFPILNLLLKKLNILSELIRFKYSLNQGNPLTLYFSPLLSEIPSNQLGQKLTWTLQENTERWALKAPVERPEHHSAGMHCWNPIRLLGKTEKGKRSKLILLDCGFELPHLAPEREGMNHKAKWVASSHQDDLSKASSDHIHKKLRNWNTREPHVILELGFRKRAISYG